VDQGIISLEDKTSKYIRWWTKDARDPRSHTTLRHHLSMTDGFGQWVDPVKYPGAWPVCWAQPDNSMTKCVREAYNKAYGRYGKSFASPPGCPDSPSFNLTDPDVPFPGQAFHYEENHWAMARMMVEKATSQKFNDVANTKFFKPLGMVASYDWPSARSPDLGGGVSTTLAHYEKFLRAALNSQLLSASAWENLFKPHTTQAKEGYSVMECEAAASGVRTWGYGLGNWLHCKEAMPSACLGNKRHSSMGFGGFFPAVDLRLGMYLVISQEDPTGNSMKSALELQNRLFAALESQISPKKTNQKQGKANANKN
jgi:CubicO group peptidase (beta-lactamase class C family)